jgi:hypothetical protein
LARSYNVLGVRVRARARRLAVTLPDARRAVPAGHLASAQETALMFVPSDRFRRCFLLCAAASTTPAFAETVTLTELSPPAGYTVAGVANIAADGTVVGVAWPDGYVVRWVPGAEPEVIGGGLTFTLENIMPFISKDASVIATSGWFSDGTIDHAAPEIWQGGTDWEMVSGLTLGDSTPYGISYDGHTLVGGSFPNGSPAGSTPQQTPWVWTEADGQQALGMLQDTTWGEAWAIGNDRHVAAGFFKASVDGSTRYGARWVGGVPQWILDGEGQNVGQAIACNSGCSIIVGAGRDSVSPQAWRWTEAGGIEFLGTPEGASPDAMYYAFESSEDGSVIVGSYFTIDPLLGAVNRGFLWTERDGMQDLVTYLANHGIEYGDGFTELVVCAITPDGRTLLINGADADYLRQRAVVHIEPDDSIFADGFDINPI